ncbi:hypothetical protein ABZS83_05075 [Streptomyces sp. NPDC005426]|uniref:hypothetical protein n=1 Tax=Streptomyces sp. NPDC005426 TaxID=3155344 RepID=UPI0033BE2BA7
MTPNRCCAMASFNAARSVALIRSRVVGPTVCRNGGMASMASFIALRLARCSAPFHGTVASSSMAARRWAFSSRISVFASAMAWNISER